MKVLVTGGAGFIGSNFVRYFLMTYPDAEVVNFDKLTYAGNLDNLKDIEGDARYSFIQGDIADPEAVARALPGVEAVFNFAAESHVDRSILGATDFIRTNAEGVYIVLSEARKADVKRVVCVSTDEVYGSIESGSSKETDPIAPRNPYSAAKAGGDMQALAFFNTHKFPVLVTRGSNTYGPYQYPEKLASLFITNAIDDEPLPLYGDGLQIRDWLHVEDHCRGIDVVFREGQPGEIYNIDGGMERTNLDVTERILESLEKDKTLIQHVEDRPGHDRRYSMDAAKLKKLGWKPEVDFEKGLADTVEWYVQNEWWWRKIKSGEFLEYYRQNYGDRARLAR